MDERCGYRVHNGGRCENRRFRSKFARLAWLPTNSGPSELDLQDGPRVSPLHREAGIG